MKRNNELIKFFRNNNYSDIRKIARPSKIDWNAPTAVFSTRIAIFFLKLGLTPNKVTLTWTLLASISTLLLWFGEYTANLLFILLYIVFYAFDYVDGDMARILKKANPKLKQNILASWLDKFYYYIHRALVVLGISLGAFVSTSNISYLYLGIATSFLVFSGIFMKLLKKSVLLSKGKYKEAQSKEIDVQKTGILHEFIIPFIRPEPFSLLTLAIIFNLINFMVYFYFIIFLLSFIRTYYEIFISLRTIYRD